LRAQFASAAGSHDAERSTLRLDFARAHLPGLGKSKSPQQEFVFLRC
jgi:hypothetical protein